MKRRLILAFSFALLLTAVYVGVYAAVRDAPVPAPLSEVQKLKIQNSLQKLEIMQARMQMLQGEFTKTQGELQEMIKGVTHEGYDLNLQTMEYVKREKK